MLEKLYIKFRMFFIANDIFWDKFDFYTNVKNYDLKRAYIQARWHAGLIPDFRLEGRSKNKWEKDIELFDSLTHKELVERGLVEVHENNY